MITTERHIQEKEDKFKEWYGVFRVSDGKLLDMWGGPNMKGPIEPILKGTVEHKESPNTTVDITGEEVVVIRLDSQQAYDWFYNGTLNENRVYPELVSSKKVRGRRKPNGDFENPNTIHGNTPASHPRKFFKTSKKFAGIGLKKGVLSKIISGISVSQNPAVDVTKPANEAQAEYDAPSTRWEISLECTFTTPQAGRLLLLVRADGKLCGRYSVASDETSVLCTWYDWSKGTNEYQVQLKSPIDNDEMENLSLVIEEDEEIA